MSTDSDDDLTTEALDNILKAVQAVGDAVREALGESRATEDDSPDSLPQLNRSEVSEVLYIFFGAVLDAAENHPYATADVVDDSVHVRVNTGRRESHFEVAMKPLY